jgi:ribosome-associated translation inhibitor RaiA
LRAEATSFNDLAAFDDAIESVELQIRKIHEKSKSISRQTLRTMKVDESE